jgi:hypothetical protein
MVSALETPHQSTFELPVRPLKINYPNSMNRKLCTQQIKKLLNNLTVKKNKIIFEMSTLSLRANGKWIHHDSYRPSVQTVFLKYLIFLLKFNMFCMF